MSGRGRKTGIYLICPQCKKEFYIIKSRIKKSENHCCSILCKNRFSAPARSLKLRKRVYPFVAGICKNCKKDIIVKSAGFDKLNRIFCSKSCKTIYSNKNMVWTEEMRKNHAEKCRKRFKGTKRKRSWVLKQAKTIRGKNHWNWQNGKTKKSLRLRNGYRYRKWRDLVYKRDNWTCQKCGARSMSGKPVILNADHIKSWAKYPKLRYDISNGRTLCLSCHIKTDNFGIKSIYQKI